MTTAWSSKMNTMSFAYHVSNDGYVFSTGLLPTKKPAIIANISDMLSDSDTTPAAVRKQIEHYLIKSGDTGFGLGDFFMISRHVCTSTFN